MSRNTLAIAALLLCACRPSPKVVVDPSPTALDPARLTEVLDLQFQQARDAWNRGDLDTFLTLYAEDATFVDGRRPQRGIAWIRANYTPAFAPGASRDSLEIKELTARPLSTTLALVTARYVLYRGAQTTQSGPFTVIMEERTDGWKILHDHSSSDPR
jgi:uncharacterized protein (TIGR02246 family)